MTTWPLVGRTEELGFVVAALRGERTRGVVIAGALGVGKTRLAREAAAVVEDALVVEWLAATSTSAHIPFGAVATEIQTGKMVVFTEGSLPLAIRASCALPIFYVPVMVNGRMMVDGGLVGHIPGSVARMMGADVVIAVDVNSQHLPIPPPTHMFTVMSQALAVIGRHATSYLYQDADVVIRPQIERVRPDDLSKAAEMIAAGEEAARRVIPNIKQLLAPRKQGFFNRVFARPAPTPDARRVTMLEGKRRR